MAWWWQTRVKPLWSVKLPALLGSMGTASGAAAQRGSFEFGNDAGALATPEGNDGITAILTLYRRGEYLPQQIRALREQSVPPEEIWVWCNSSDKLIADVSHLADRVIVSNSNWKFWGRFALASLARTEYVCLFDDDILPQPEWLANCLDSYANGHEGILGGSGVLLEPEGGYSSRVKVGWNGNHLDTIAEVDLVGHAWFFRKRWLKYMWFEEPLSWENGEDIHFSYMALKHGGLSTLVPPHPDAYPERWSCRPDFGKAVGRRNAATYKSSGHHAVRDDIVRHYREDGWQVVAQREGSSGT